MTFTTRAPLLTMLLLLHPAGVTGAAGPYTGPNDEKAVAAAEAAVAEFDQTKGALSIHYESFDIVGLQTAISEKSVEIEETLDDLNAKRVGAEIQIALSGDVLFDFDKWEIRSEAEETLFKVAGVVKELDKKNVLIEGHTDSRGSESYNLELSDKRARSVRDWLSVKGELDQVNFETRGYGESKPIAPNTKSDGSDDPEGRAENRRVEITIKKN